MSKSEKKYFDQIKAMLNKSGNYDEIFDHTIQHAAKILVLIEEAENLVLIEEAENPASNNAMIQRFATGAKQIAPEINLLKALMSDFQTYAKVLGLTPASAKALQIGIKKENKAAKLSIMKLAK